MSGAVAAISDSGWAVVTTRCMAEMVAAQALKARGWRVYLPLGRKMLRGVRVDMLSGRRVRTRGPGEIVLRPVFTGYVFAELHAGQQWSPILSERGVAGLLQNANGDRPQPRLLSGRGIEQLRALEGDGFFDELRCRRGKVGARPDLKVGDTVLTPEVTEGHKFEGVLRRLADDDDKAIVGILIFGREVPVTVSAETLELVAP